MWRTPSFWWREKSWPLNAPFMSFWAFCLWPLSILYRCLQWVVCSVKKIWRPAIKAPFPVISLGNLVMGGSGKTPLTVALADLLREEGRKPVVIMRGYGGTDKGPVWVNPKLHTSFDVGDEALMLAHYLPTLVARRRADGLRLLPADPQTVILLDDGHQHTSLVKDVSLLVIDARQGHGNGWVFPSGPLRESYKQGMARADGIVWIGEEPPFMAVPVFQAHIKASASLEKGTRVVGFAGIGYPPKFQQTLNALSLNVVHFMAFPDHYPYLKRDLDALEQMAITYGAALVTTEKDAQRLPPRFREGVACVKIDVVWDAKKQVKDFLRERL